LERRLQRSKGETAYQGDLLQVLQFCSPETPGPLEAQSRTGLGELCRRWLRPETHSKEQFLTILPEELQARVREQHPLNGDEAMLEESLMIRDFRWEEVFCGGNKQHLLVRFIRKQ